MSQEPKLATRTGVIEPEPGSVASPARRQLLALGTALCGASLASAILGPPPARADFIKNVGKILYLEPIVLNFAYEMEELQADFFRRLNTERGWDHLYERERDTLNQIAAQDAYHFERIGFLRQQDDYQTAGHSEDAEGALTRRSRFFVFPEMKTRDQLLRTAIDIKETCLFAYHGAIELLSDKDILALAAAIAGVEGRHATVLRVLYGIDPVTAPFEGALDAQTAGNKLTNYNFRGGGIE